MRAVYEERVAEARAIEGQLSAGGDSFVIPEWVWWARHCFPEKTAAHLASIAGKDERTAKRWLSGEFEPPNVVMFALIARLHK